MRRRLQRPSRGNENPISLFPFLAVLICTMGVLILLLVILVRQARLKALAEAQRKASLAATSETIPSEKDLRQWEEDLPWEEEQLKAARAKTQEQLSEVRAVLGHVEDSLRRLRQEALAWQQKLRELQSLQEAAGSERSERIRRQQRDLEELKERIAALKQKVEHSKRQPGTRSYAIIPYQGPHGTTRRPIYLECRGDGVYLQPESIRFPPSDFLGPLGPGNPLDAALRAVREEWLARKEFDPRADGEPYPLLIVRPSGIEAYYAARAALTSWGTDFGYELVEEDWALAYPPPDARVAHVVHEAIELARRRQEFLARSAPTRFGRRPKQFRAAPFVGGAVSDGAGSNDEVEERDPMLAQWQRKAQSSGYPQGEASEQEYAATAAATTGEWQTSPDNPVESADHIVSDQELWNKHDIGLTASAVPEVSSESPQVPPVNRAIEEGAKVLGAAIRAEVQKQAGEPDVLGLHPLAERYGEGWALLSHDRTSIPVTRPIRVECYSDRVVLSPDTPSVMPRVFFLNERPEEAVKALAGTIKEWIADWGIAGRGMYWRPVLRVYVAADAERQFKMLERLLAGSGLLIERAASTR